MTTAEAKSKLLNNIISCEIGSYTTLYAPEKAVITITNLLNLNEGLTKYRARIALKELIVEGLIEYTSQGCPAVESFGEYRELVCDARPPINGYALTKKGFESDMWKQAYAEWCKSMVDWANSEVKDENVSTGNTSKKG